MFKIFKNRKVMMILGLILLVLLIWFFGDAILFFVFGDSIRWFDSSAGRVAGITVVVALFLMWELFKTSRANQANNRLATAVVDQAKADQRPSADVVQLRERFEEAVANLKQQKKRGGLGLYELPWYVIIGAPGSGKTTALKYSGLKFPLEQRSGRAALRGVGGTRNCDWWFTEEAVLLDTAGRYTTQDSDASADSAGWAEFLALLKKYRKRRPLNGVLLAISAQDLLTQGQAGREAHVAAARRRLNELNKELKIQLPVYVLVTKCDLLAGFSEYFDDMSPEGRAQVLGVTFPHDVTLKGEAAGHFPAEFDAVVQRLNERVYSRLEDERDGRRRAKVFGFPQQMAALRESLAEFVADVFESTRFDQRVLLRGVYFTSGTQEGTPIDRLLGALGRRLSVSADAVAPTGQGKAYFIERLLKQVVLAESGLAGVSRRLEIQKAAAQFGLYIGMLAAGVIVLMMLTYSYRTNLAFLDSFEAKVIDARDGLPPAGESAITALPRLDRIRSLVDEVRVFRNETSWFSRGWGLDQAGPIDTAARDLYRGELNLALLAPVRARIEQRLETLIAGGDPLDLYESLRAYLMLKDTSTAYFDANLVADVATGAWQTAYPGREEDVRQLDAHFSSLLDAGLPGRAVNDELVGRARSAIPPEATPRLVLALVRRTYDKDHPRTTPIFSSALFQNRNRQALGEDIPGIFTEPGFRAAEGGLIKDAGARFAAESWVWGSERPRTGGRQEEVWRLYESQYIEQWAGLLRTVGLASPPGGDGLVDLINRMAGERAGLKEFLQTVDRNTYLVPPPEDKAPPTIIGSAVEWLNDRVRSAPGPTTVPGSQVTYEFRSIHFLVVPEGKAVIDELLPKLKDMGAKLSAMKPGVVGAKVDGAGAVGLSQAATDLKQSARGLTGPAANISNLIESLGSAVEKSSAVNVVGSLRTQYNNLLSQCRQTIGNAFPFYADAENEVPIQDFERLFGAEGFQRFIRDSLAEYAEERNGLLAAKQMPSGSTLEIGGILATVNAAEEIRRALMPSGSARFAFQVDVADMDGRTLKFELPGILFEGGKPLTFTNQRMDPMPALWPTKPGEVAARFEVNPGRTTSLTGGNGAWAWFKLVRRGTLTEVNDTTFRLKLAVGDAYAELLITTGSRVNPLGLMRRGALARFRCDR